jgi:outer membrane protein assembly factor BamB
MILGALPLSFALAISLLQGCRSPAASEGTSQRRTVAPRWQSEVGAAQVPIALAAVTPRMVIAGGVGTLVGLDPTNGQRKWELTIPFLLPFAGIVVLDETLAALVTGDGFVVFDPRDGRAIRTWVEPNPRRNPSGTLPQQLSDGRIIYASRGRDLLALDARAARLDTLTKLPGDSTRNSYVVSLAVYRDTIYAPVASDAARGAAFRNTTPYRYAVRTGVLDSLRPDPSDSASLTRWMLPYESLLVSATNYSEPSWLAFDRATGERKWKVAATPASLGPYSQVAVVGDTMFAGGNDGVAYVIHLPTGRLLRTMPIPSGLVAGVVACGRDVFFNVIGQMTGYSRDGTQRIQITGLAEGKEGFSGFFSTGAGIAVIGDGGGRWTAFPCDPPA